MNYYFFGGDNNFFRKLTGKDSIYAKIEKELKHKKISFSIRSEYMNSQVGYSPFNLYVWDTLIMDFDFKPFNEPTSSILFEHELIDLNIGVKVLSSN